MAKHIFNLFRSYCFANKSPCTKLGIKIELRQCLMSWYGKSITFEKNTTTVHNYQLESGSTLKFLEFVWSEQLVLDGQAYF